MSNPKLKTLIYRDLTQTMSRSTFVHLLPWQFTMIRLAPSKSLLWSSRPPNGYGFLQMEEEHPLCNLISMKLDAYIPILPFNSPTSCP
jgi:hypothetical protein